jgi:uncharacterized protein with von Willebrand factor type A (vWA) domain
VLDQLETFCGLLRKNHVRVSVSEVVDAVQAVRAVGLDSPSDLRATLAATLVKRPGDASTFDELFTLFFLRGGDLARGLEGKALAPLLAEIGLGEDDIERLLAVLADQAARSSRRWRAPGWASAPATSSASCA